MACVLATYLFSLPGAVPTQEAKLLPHGRAQSPAGTNKPEITAHTVKPTTNIIEPTMIHSPRQNNPFDARTQVRDQLLLSKLRNRYRQVG